MKLVEKKAKLEEIKDKESEQYNLQTSSQLIYKSSISMNPLIIEVDHVQMYEDEFQLAGNDLI